MNVDANLKSISYEAKSKSSGDFLSTRNSYVKTFGNCRMLSEMFAKTSQKSNAIKFYFEIEIENIESEFLEVNVVT